jgi:hypothetical protein
MVRGDECSILSSLSCAWVELLCFALLVHLQVL